METDKRDAPRFADAIDYQEFTTWKCRICGAGAHRVKYGLGSEAEKAARDHWKATHED